MRLLKSEIATPPKKVNKIKIQINSVQALILYFKLLPTPQNKEESKKKTKQPNL